MSAAERGRPSVPSSPPPSLFDAPETTKTGRRKKGENRLALERQLRRLRARKELDGRGETLVALCRSLADALDVAHRRMDLFAAAALAPQLRAALAELEPTETTDGLADFLDGLRPSLGDAAHT